MSNSLEAPSEEAGRPRVLLALTGSVASVKAEALVRLLLAFAEVRVVASAHSLHFFDLPHLRTLVPVYLDEDEWKTYSRGDPVLHIELRKWADCLLIAPLSANSLAEIALGLCPNLVTCVARAWDFSKPLLLAPAMNTAMWLHPITSQHLTTIEGFSAAASDPTVVVINPIAKLLACGDHGYGAMAEVGDIAQRVREVVHTTTTTQSSEGVG